MNHIAQTEAAAAAGRMPQKTEAAEKSEKKSQVSGAVIGDAKLSEKAKKYYEKLKAKYSNMDFILVSEDKKQEAQANAGKYANANRMVVLIDTEKVERMATDESYRKKYEAIISGSASQLGQLKDSLGANASSVKTFGMQVKDGGKTSFFAVVDKSLAAQKKRIEKNAEKKAAEKKAAAKKEAKKAAQEKLEEKKKTNELEESEDTVMITASSIEELIQKINDTIYDGMSDYVMTDEEKQVGGHIDFYG